MASPNWSAQQRHAFGLIERGFSVLLMGMAGTGKSHILQEISIRMPEIHITATTGAGAVATGVVGASTFASFCGLRPLSPDEEECFEVYWAQLKTNTFILKRLRELRGLIIDEISMMHGRLLIIVHLIFCAARGVHDLPFAGVQMILVGDFLQLPPVFRKNDPWGKVFAFQVFKMLEFFPMRVDLVEVFRQDNPAFVKAMTEAREGRLSASSLQFIKTCALENARRAKNVKPTAVLRTHVEVNFHNQSQMDALPNEGNSRQIWFVAHYFVASSNHASKTTHRVFFPCNSAKSESVCAHARQRMMQHLDRRPEVFPVRTGQEVVFTTNITTGTDFSGQTVTIVNGSRARVVGWTRMNTSVELATTTVHLISNSDARSFVKLNPSDAGPDNAVVPVLRLARGGALVVVHPHISLLPTGAGPNIYLGVRQLPFISAWALTTQKVQGMTLDSVHCKIGPEHPGPAQLYVVLSRVRSPDGIFMDKPQELTARMFWNEQCIRQKFGQASVTAVGSRVWCDEDMQEDHPSHNALRKWKVQAQEASGTIETKLQNITPVICAVLKQPNPGGPWVNVTASRSRDSLERSRTETNIERERRVSVLSARISARVAFRKLARKGNRVEGKIKHRKF